MRNQIIFYIIWDALFLAILIGYFEISTWAQKAYFKFQNPEQIYFFIFYPIFIGGMIALLSHISNKFSYSKKLALMELIFVGGLGLFLATTLLLPTLISSLVGSSLPFLFKFWILYGTTPNIIGSLLLGYVLFRFFSRMVSNSKIASKSEQ